MAEMKANFYPKFVVKNNTHPNKLLAFPLFGLIIKLILLIPVAFVLFVYNIIYVFYLVVIPFYILFTGKYWDAAYAFFVSYLKYETKISLYVYGLTDKYPGFSLNDGGLFSLHIDKPLKPKKWKAAPIIGFVIRFILLLPYLIYVSVLQNGSTIAMIASWFTVLVKGRYPESLYEFNRDTIRVSNASFMYMTYLSDKYPSFWISMDHQTIKIFLIILGAFMSTPTVPHHFPSKYDKENQLQNNYQYDLPTPPMNDNGS